MILKALLEECEYTLVKGDENINIQYITGRLDEIKENSLFIMCDDMSESNVDKAIKKGAIAIITSKDIHDKDSITIIKVSSSTKAMAQVSIKYFNNPTFNFRLVGVAGTSGKTGTINLIEKVMYGVGKKIGIIGTGHSYIGEEVLSNDSIDQNSIKLQHLFHEMSLANVSDVIMEVSSKTIEVDRIYGVHFDIAVLTNIKDKNSEFYENFKSYKSSKRKLFEKSNMAVINIDDCNYKYITDGLEFKKTITYSVNDMNADLYAQNIVHSEEKIIFDLKYLGVVYKMKLATNKEVVEGQSYDTSNVLAAIGTCLLANVSIENIVSKLNG